MPIAIDFGTRAIHLVQGQASKTAVTVRKAVVEQIPSGLIQNGVIQEFGRLEMALQTLLDKYHIHDRSCIVTINSSHIYNRELDVPNTKSKTLDNVVAFEVQSTMSIPTGKEVAVEYTLSKQKVPDKPDLLHVRASAMQVDYINEYAKLLKNCGLTPTAMDIHPNALRKLMANADINDRPQREGGSIMFIDMGAVTSSTYIITNGEITYSRIIPSGGIDIERYVTARNSEAGENDQIDISSLDLSLANLRSNESLGNSVRPLVTTVNDNIQRISQFLSGRMQGGKVDIIYLFGRTAICINLEKTLGEAFGIQTEVISKISKVSMPENVPIAPFINAIGAMIRLQS
jgi:type IV pilus assembly protein PilM